MTDQNSQFFAILTAIGRAKQANADALGVPWTFAQMGVGDANGADPIPSEQQTQLINERRRAPLNQLKVDPANASVIIAEQVIPETVGGWWIREVGLYDADGDLVAVANCAPSFKPLLSQGSGRTQVVRMNLIVSNTANVELKIDPSVVLATRAYVDGLTVRANQVEAEAGTENSKIMTPLRVFQAIAKVVKQATEAAFGWAKVATQVQVTTGTDDSTIITPKKLRAAQATQAEAEAGTDNRKIMTPLLVFQAIAKVVTQATETAFGWAKIATKVLVDAGTDNATIVTPLRLKSAYGLGDSKYVEDLDNADIGFFYALAAATGAPPGASGILHGETRGTAGSSTKVQTCIDVSTGQMFKRVLTGTGRPWEVWESDAKATQAEAEAGTDNSKVMTSLRVLQAITKVVKQATETVFGWAKIATQTQANAGTDDTTIITPKKLRMGFSVSLTANGYIALPSWMGGLIIQWVGYGGSLAAGSSTVINFPIAFPNSVFRVAATPVNVTQNGTIPISVAPDFTAGIDFKVGLTVRNLSTQTTQVNLLAIGN